MKIAVISLASGLLLISGCCTPCRVARVPRPAPLPSSSANPAAIANRLMLSLLTMSPLARHPGIAIQFEQPKDPKLHAVFQALQQDLLREGYAIVSEAAPFLLVVTYRPASAASPGALEAHMIQRSEPASNPVWTYEQTYP